MGHHVTGLIASRDTLGKLGGPLNGQPHFALKEGLGFLPLDYKNLDDVVGLDAGDAIGKFEYLSPKLIELLECASQNCALAYIETDYHGGTGGQSSVVFRDGKVVFGPISAERNAINGVLSVLGVKANPGDFDVFETIGLKRHRYNEDFRDTEDSA